LAQTHATVLSDIFKDDGLKDMFYLICCCLLLPAVLAVMWIMIKNFGSV
jgi:hypothetical protein